MRYVFLAIAILGSHLRADQVNFRFSIFDFRLFLALAPLVELPPAPQLSTDGYQLILDYEVGGGQRYYERFLLHPTWPGAASGITVGVGYDCGYNSRAVILADWKRLDERERLARTAGLKMKTAKEHLAEVRDILISWELAEGVFQHVTLARFYQLARRTFPGLEDLHPNAQAALVSLIFNRGNSMSGPSRVEMREIRRLVPLQDYGAIAGELRKMKRLWAGRNLDGLIRRREAEARLVESCLASQIKVN